MGWVKNTFYEMVNVATGKYMNLAGEHAGGAVNNGNTVDLYSRTGSYDQHWCVEYFPYNGATYLRIMCRQGGAWYTLNRHSGNNSCIVWHVNQIVAADSALELFTVDDANKKYRIALAMTNPMLYLTAVGNQLYWRPYAGNDTQLFQFLDPGAAPDPGPGDSKRLNMPVNINQKAYSEPVFSQGCALCCGVDVSSYYGNSSNNNVSYFVNNYWGSNGYSWGAPNAVMTEGKYSLSILKTEIDAGRPVVVHATGGGTQHWVVAFGYTSNAASTSNILVLDPYQGVERTLHDAMRKTCGNDYSLGRIKTTRQR